jgi:hypothetical protein
MKNELNESNELSLRMIKKFKCLKRWMISGRATFNSKLLNIQLSDVK